MWGVEEGCPGGTTNQTPGVCGRKGGENAQGTKKFRMHGSVRVNAQKPTRIDGLEKGKSGSMGGERQRKRKRD